MAKNKRKLAKSSYNKNKRQYMQQRRSNQFKETQDNEHLSSTSEIEIPPTKLQRSSTLVDGTPSEVTKKAKKAAGDKETSLVRGLKASINEVHAQLDLMSGHMSQILAQFSIQTQQLELIQKNQVLNAPAENQVEPFYSKSGQHFLMQSLTISYKTYASTLQVDLELVNTQVQSLSQFEMSKISQYHNSPVFWEYFVQLKFLQMAVFMTTRLIKKVANKTLNGCIVALKHFSLLYLKQNTTYIGLYELQQAPSLLEQAGGLNTATCNKYLQVLQNMARTVSSLFELRLRLDTIEPFVDKAPLITIDDLLQIINSYKSSQLMDEQLFGFCLYLLFTSGARNETIRKLKFDQIYYRNDEYFILLRASKTRKEQRFKIDSTTYDFVQRVKEERLKWIESQRLKLQCKQAGKNPDDDYAKRKEQLLLLREKHLFTFQSESALHNRIQNMKDDFDIVKGIDEFIVHNIRKIRIRSVFQKQGLDAAVKFAQHSKKATTLDYYIGSDQEREIRKWDTPNFVTQFNEQQAGQQSNIKSSANNRSTIADVSDNGDDYENFEDVNKQEELKSEDDENDEDEDVSLVLKPIQQQLITNNKHYTEDKSESDDYRISSKAAMQTLLQQVAKLKKKNNLLKFQQQQQQKQHQKKPQTQVSLIELAKQQLGDDESMWDDLMGLNKNK